MEPEDLSALPTDTVIALALNTPPSPHRSALAAELRRRQTAHTSRATTLDAEIVKLQDEWTALDRELDELAAALEGLRDE